MSIEGIANYEYARMNQIKPAWETLERIDYCDHPLPSGNRWLKLLKGLLRKKA